MKMFIQNLRAERKLYTLNLYLDSLNKTLGVEEMILSLLCGKKENTWSIQFEELHEIITSSPLMYYVSS